MQNADMYGREYMGPVCMRLWCVTNARTRGNAIKTDFCEEFTTGKISPAMVED